MRHTTCYGVRLLPQPYNHPVTMVHCADTNEQARADAEESFLWYPKTAGFHIGALAERMEEREGKTDLGNYSCATEALERDRAHGQVRHPRVRRLSTGRETGAHGPPGRMR